MTNQNLRFSNENESNSRTTPSARPSKWLALAAFGAVLSLSGLSAGSAMAQDSAPVAAGPRTDSQVEMDVVHALDAAQALKDDWITAGTVQGEVTLSGTSASDANRKMAEQIAGQVPGVTKVVNNLKVGNPQSASDAQGQVSGQVADQEQVATNDVPPPPAGPDNAAGAPAAGYPAPGSPRPTYRPVAPPPPQYPQQPQYAQQQPQYPQQPQYSQQQPAPAPLVPETPHAPVTVPQGTLLKVRTSEALGSKKAKDGEPVEFVVVRDIWVGGALAIPRGATITGKVVDVKKAGALGGSAELALKLDTLNLAGNSYALDSDQFAVRSPNKAGHTVGSAFGGAVLGAIIGGAVGGGSGAAIGAGAGAVGGTAASAATPGPQVWIPSEALIDFHLNTPVTVTPVSRAEAQRLAANAAPLQGAQPRPTLYRRGYYPYGYPPPPPPPGYYAPYPY